MRAISGPVDFIEIQSVVVSTGIDQKLGPEALAGGLPNADLSLDNFPDPAYRIQDPKAVALIPQSGKIVCTGVKSIDDMHGALRIIFDRLRELKVPADDEPEIAVQSIISNTNLRRSLNLNVLAIRLGPEGVKYESERLPSLVYQMDEPKAVILLFSSRGIVITGRKRTDDAETAIEGTVGRIDTLGLLG